MSRFLLDANLSPRTAQFLREELGLDAVHLRDLAAGSPTDEEVAVLARREQRVIITFDRDFGEICTFPRFPRLVQSDRALLFGVHKTNSGHHLLAAVQFPAESMIM